MISDAFLKGVSAGLPTRIERWRTILANQPADERTWVVIQHGQVVGFVGTGPSRDADASPETAEVYAVYLLQEAAGQGIGRALFGYAVDDLRQRGFRRATLWMLASNERTRAFYEAAGWTPDDASKVDERPGVTLHEIRYSAELA